MRVTVLDAVLLTHTHADDANGKPVEVDKILKPFDLK
jgi:phosphoribosyl 1,2-cyclic phosphodiesterase